MAVGRIFDLKRYSIHDGPGIRTTVFLQGCPLSCPWCHNPESRPASPVPAFRVEQCLRCLACGEVCPADVKPDPDHPWPAVCEQCGRCVGVCPAGARELSGRDVDADTLLGELARDRLHFEESGGGVTFGGGEPLGQPDFLLALARGCRDRELHTVVDTTGHARADVIEALAPLVDLWLYDLKHPDPAAHAALTGVDNALILANLARLAEDGRAIWLRVPVVPGLNDDPETVARTGRLARELGIRRVHLLPYHAAARGKRRRFGLADPGDVFRSPRPTDLSRLAARLGDLGLDVHLGG